MSSLIKEDLPKSITSDAPVSSKFQLFVLLKCVFKLKKQLEKIELVTVSSVLIEQ
jgi:hypothetical protein